MRPRSGPSTSGPAPSPPCRPASGWSRRRKGAQPTPEQQVARAVAGAGRVLGSPARAQALAISAVLAGDLDKGKPTKRFYKNLKKVKGWETLPPSIAVHRVLGTPDPFRYEPHWPPAVKMLASFSPSEARAVESLVSAGGRAPSRCYAAASDVSALPLPSGHVVRGEGAEGDRRQPAEHRTGPAAGGRDPVRGRLRHPGRRGHRGQGHRHPGQRDRRSVADQRPQCRGRHHLVLPRPEPGGRRRRHRPGRPAAGRGRRPRRREEAARSAWSSSPSTARATPRSSTPSSTSPSSVPRSRTAPR